MPAEPVELADTPDGTRLLLRGRVTVSAAARLHRAALELVARPGRATVDCSEVSQLDVSAIQILMCLDRALAARGQRGALTGLPPAVGADFALLGLGGAEPPRSQSDALRAAAGLPPAHDANGPRTRGHQ